MTKQTTAVAARTASTQSHMSHPKYLFKHFSRHSGAKKHSQDHHVQQVLDLGHALVSFTQRTIYAVVSFCANGFMHGKFSLHCFHLRPSEALPLLEFHESTGTPLGKDVYRDNPQHGLKDQQGLGKSFWLLKLSATRPNGCRRTRPSGNC